MKTAVVGFLLLLLAAVVLLSQRVGGVSFEDPTLLALLNSLFLYAVPLIIAALAARSYRATGVLPFLLLGCGLLIFGLSSLVAGWVIGGAGSPNPTLVLHNTGSLLAGICNFVSAFLIFIEFEGVTDRRVSWFRIAAYYGAVVLLVAVIAVFALGGSAPAFFVQGSGPTPLRQWVLGSAMTLFAMSGILFMGFYARAKTEFAYWYGVALLLIAIGLLSVFLQHTVGGMLGWVGRGAQYLGCLVMGFALLRGNQEVSQSHAVTAGTNAVRFWPYLEQQVHARTGILQQANDALKEEISARRHSEEELRESEARYRSLFENAPVGIFYSTDKGKIVRVNNEYARMMGYASPEEVKEAVNKSTIAETIYVHHDERAPLIKNVVESSGRWMRIEHHFRRKDGAHITANLIIRAQPENPTLLEGFVEDITERKQAEDSLRQSEERLQKIIEQSPMSMAIVSLDGVIEYINRKAIETFGTSSRTFPIWSGGGFRLIRTRRIVKKSSPLGRMMLKRLLPIIVRSSAMITM